jgi:hypothetical protein
MRNLKDIIIERLNISNNVILERLVLSKHKNDIINAKTLKSALKEYTERVNSIKICIDDLPSFKDYKSLYDADKLPLINVEQKLCYGMLRGSGEAYLQNIEYDDGFASAPIRINYILKSHFDVTNIKKHGIQIFRADMTIENFIELFKDNQDVLTEIYEFIK